MCADKRGADTSPLPVSTQKPLCRLPPSPRRCWQGVHLVMLLRHSAVIQTVKWIISERVTLITGDIHAVLLMNELNELLQRRNQGTSVQEHSLSPGNQRIISSGLCCLCLCGISDIPLNILWDKFGKTKPPPLLPPFSFSQTYLNKQWDAGLSCSIVVSGRLCTRVEALADYFWIEFGSRPIPRSSVPQPATCLIRRSIFLWGEK